MWPTLHAGDRCRLDASTDSLEIGDVVAIQWAGKRRVKRVAGLGGDVIDRRAGRLVINGTRVEDRIATHSSTPYLAPSLIVVSKRATDFVISNDGDWWFYRHVNPHAGGRETLIMDDYPINENVRRTLHTVDRLIVRSSCGDPEATIFFRLGSTTYSSKLVNGVARSRDATETESAIPFAPKTQVAARPGDLDSQACDLQVWREIEYRDDHPSGVLEYPLTLDEREVFVVGDNVPVSVDSRSFGPIHRDRVLGKVIMTERNARATSEKD